MVRTLGIKVAILIILLSFVAVASAQQTPGQWVNDLYLVDDLIDLGKKDGKFQGYLCNMVFIDESNNIRSSIPALRKAPDFPVPEEYITSSRQFWYNDALYAIASGPGKTEKDENGSKFRRYTFARWQKENDKDEGQWHYLGEYRNVTDGYSDLKAFPCDNDRFIVVSRFNDLAGDNRPDRSPFVRMRVNPDKKTAVVENSIYHGIDELKPHMSNQKFLDLACNAYFVVTGKYATIVNPNTGLYWCFSLEKASLIRAGSIFKTINMEEIVKTVNKGGLMMAVLGVNPEKEGSVLVSAQEEVALKHGIENKWSDIQDIMEQNPHLSKEAAEKLFMDHMNKIQKSSKYMAWYRIHPENGRVEKLYYPPEGGAEERSGTIKNFLTSFRADEWRPLPDGSVRMGQVNVRGDKK